ncbi:MAG: hypothetical protein J6U54_16660 [Clostridiales bacterium]|nr:hypothetical protein [Clostridiales bacterium]
MNTLKKVFSFVALFLVATLVLGTLGINSNVSAADDSTYYVCSAATSSNIYEVKDGVQEPYDDFVYCSDIDLAGPNTSVKYDQGLLSSSELDDATRSKLMVILMERSAIKDKIEELAISYPESMSYWKVYGSNDYAYQHLVWIILSEDKFFARTDTYGYEGICKAMTGSVDNKDDSDSFWNQFFVPLRDFITGKASSYKVGTGEGEYDAYFYHPSDTSYQRLLGKGWMKPVTPKGNLLITKKIEGKVTEEDLKNLTFTVTDSDGKNVGTYLLGQDFTYDASTGLYTKELTGLNPSLTYTVEESLYTITGMKVSVTYKIGKDGSETEGTKADVSITANETTTVAFTDSYTEEVTTTTTTTTSETSATTPSTSETSAVVVSGSEETTAPSIDKDATEDTTAPSAVTTDPSNGVVTGTQTNPASDSARPSDDSANVSGKSTDSTEGTTAASTKTSSSSEKSDRATTSSSRVTSTGEAISYTLIAGVAALFTACVIMTLRNRKFKDN